MASKDLTATKTFHVEMMFSDLKMVITEQWEEVAVLMTKEICVDTSDGFDLKFDFVVSYQRGLHGEPVLSYDLVSDYHVRSSNVKAVMLHSKNEIEPVTITTFGTHLDDMPEGEYYIFCNLLADFELSPSQNLSLEVIKFYNFQEEEPDYPVLESNEEDLVPVSSHNLARSSKIFRVS